MDFGSLRTQRGTGKARFAARYRPVDDAGRPAEGSLEHFLTERYCYYHVTSSGSVLRADLDLAPLPSQRAEVEADNVAEATGIEAGYNTAYISGFVRRQRVLAWPPQRVR